jgi:hypothetical protein
MAFLSGVHCLLPVDTVSYVATLKVATSASNTFMSFEQFFVKDMAGNELTTRPTTAALALAPASNYAGDTVGPSMESANLDMNTGRIHMEFDETVNVGSIDVSKISVRTQDDQNFVLLSSTSSSVISTVNGLTVLIQIGVDDLNAIKADPLLAVYGSFFPAEIYTRGCHWVPKHVRLKFLHACVTNGIPLGWPHFLTSSHCKLRPNTEGLVPPVELPYTWRLLLP